MIFLSKGFGGRNKRDKEEGQILFRKRTKKNKIHFSVNFDANSNELNIKHLYMGGQ